jgi:hypothetical protein
MKHKALQFGISLGVAAAALADGLHGAEVAPHADRATALVNAAAEQFQLAYRMNPGEAQHRQQQLNAVVAAWRAAPRDNVNDELFTTWLRTAIRSSMPGSSESLPSIPKFAVAKHENREQRTMAVAKPIAKESKPAVSEPAAKQVKTVAQVPSATELKTPEPTPAVGTSDKALDAALLDPFRDDPEDEQTK